MLNERRAVALLSGGVDSLCAALLAQKAKFTIYGLHFCRPRKAFEKDFAELQAKKYGFASFQSFEVDITNLIRLVQGPDREWIFKYTTLDGQEWELLPGRNFIYLTLAMNYAVGIGASVIVCGFAPHDAPPNLPPQFADYPDCHKDVVEPFIELLNKTFHVTLPTFRNVSIWLPLMSDPRTQSKEGVYMLARDLGVDILNDTVTCYTPKRVNDRWLPCGNCLACVHRRGALRKLGIDCD